MKYIVIDWYEDFNGEILGVEVSKEEATVLAAQRIRDTDGECDVQIYDSEFDPEIYKELFDRIYG